MDSHAPAFRSSGLRMAGGTIGSGSPGTAVGSHSTRLSGTGNVTSHQMPRTSNVGNSGALVFAKLDIGGASQRTVPTGGSSLSPRSARIGATPVMAAPSTHGPGSHFAYTDVDQLLNSFDGDLEELSPRGASPRVWGEETAVDASKRDWLGRPQHASTVDISPSRNGLGMTSSSKPRNEGDSSDGFFWTPRDAATTVIPKLDTSIVSPTAAGSSGISDSFLLLCESISLNWWRAQALDPQLEHVTPSRSNTLQQTGLPLQACIRKDFLVPP